MIPVLERGYLTGLMAGEDVEFNVVDGAEISKIFAMQNTIFFGMISQKESCDKRILFEACNN